MVWDLISGAGMWVIWKSRCTKVFKGKTIPPVEALKEIWAEIVYNLRGQYDGMLEDSDAATMARLAFLRTWAQSPFFNIVNTMP